MNAAEAIAWVHSLPRLANTAGVENTRRLLAILGNPQNTLQFVHIAGTNGKGSATVMLSSVLKAAGYNVGTNISPYVLDFRERFLLNGTMISEEKLADIFTRVQAAARQLYSSGWENLVEFDVVTAAALLWFSEEQCDIVCLETGLGGRLDSTNAVTNTLVACIMCIGKDHTELLGNTLTQIAREKCGIFKSGCTVVTYPLQPQEAMDEIVLAASKAKCPLTTPQAEDFYFYKCSPFENRIDYGGYDLCVPFPGRHQAYNASVVVEAAIALCDKGFTISDEAIIDGIAAARFPARIEVLSTSPLLILDGAHNADGAKALADTLRQSHCRGLTAVMGVLHGKNAEAMLTALSPFCSSIFTVKPASPRALTAQELARLAKQHCAAVTPCASVAEAIEKAKQTMDKGILVCGSLYLAAEARKILLPD